MDFLSSMATKVAGGDKESSEQLQDPDQKWQDVGKEAKEAKEGYQSRTKEGKNPDYKEVGQVAQKAFTAYKGDGEKKGLADIGKSIAGGFMGNQQQEKKEEKKEEKEEERKE
jgi:uncharacterized protein YcfJ